MASDSDSESVPDLAPDWVAVPDLVAESVPGSESDLQSGSATVFGPASVPPAPSLALEQLPEQLLQFPSQREFVAFVLSLSSRS